jgi:hypothetical protein
VPPSTAARVLIEGDAAPLFGGRAIEDAEGYIQAEGSPFKFPSGYYRRQLTEQKRRTRDDWYRIHTDGD